MIKKALFLFLFSTICAYAQLPWPSQSWSLATNLTTELNTNGVTELSGLHWNSFRNRLYCVSNDGHLYVLVYNVGSDSFTLIANKSIAGGPEGITQINPANNEFYTIDENHYEIRKFTHNSSFSTVTKTKSWNLLAAPSTMTDTGNTGPEGIVFIPDVNLTQAGFISEQTQQPYTSTKGAGGLFFVANQTGGFIWVYDINPNVDDDFLFVGKYKTNRSESCDLAFDATTNLMYILHNPSSANSLEVTNLATAIVSGNRKFVVTNEYFIPNTFDSNANIEGFAITPKCDDQDNVNVWLCRDVNDTESTTLQNDVLRWFKPFVADGVCQPLAISEIEVPFSFKIHPNPAQDYILIKPNNTNLTEEVEVQLISTLGTIISTTKANLGNEIKLSISHLAKGSYLVKINDQNQSYTKKFIKE